MMAEGSKNGGGNNIDPSTIYTYYYYHSLYDYFIHLFIIFERSDVRDCKINRHILLILYLYSTTEKVSIKQKKVQNISV